MNLTGDSGIHRLGAVRIAECEQRCCLRIGLCRDVALSIVLYRYLYGLCLGVVGNTRPVSGFFYLIGKCLLCLVAQVILAVGDGSKANLAVGLVLHFRLLRHRCIFIIRSHMECELIRIQLTAFQYFQSFEVNGCLFRLVYVLEIQLLSGSGFHSQLSGSVILHYYPECLGLGVLLQRAVARCILGYRIVNAVLGAVLQNRFVSISLCCQLLQVGDGVRQSTEVNRCILSVSGSSGGYRLSIFVTGVVYAELKLIVLYGHLVSVLIQQCLASFRCVFSCCLVGVLECRCLFLNRSHDAVFFGNLHLQGLTLGIVLHTRLAAILFRYEEGVFSFFGEFGSAEHKCCGGAVCQSTYSCIGASQNDILLIDGFLSCLIAGLQREVEFFILQHIPANQCLGSGEGGIPIQGCRCILIGKYHAVCTLASGGDALLRLQLTVYIRYLISQGVFGGIIIVACLTSQLLVNLVGVGSGLGERNLSEVRLSFTCNRCRLLAILAAFRHRCIVGTGDGEVEGAGLRRLLSANLLLHARRYICGIYRVGISELNISGSTGPGYLQGSVQIIRYNRTN